jgi:hypothetical protein
MRNKTYKLQKLEKNRYSILTNDMEHCFICKSPFVDIHEIYGGSNRKVSMANGFCLPLCREHHKTATLDSSANTFLKVKCQKEYEKTHSREEWLKLIGRNYLD